MISVEALNDRLIDLAFSEDIGDGDHTTLCCIPADEIGKSKLLIKEKGIVAGVAIAKKIFARFDDTLKVTTLIEDGTPVMPGDIVMTVEAVRAEFVTDRTPYAERNATHEWNCHYDPPLSTGFDRCWHKNTCPRYT